MQKGFPKTLIILMIAVIGVVGYFLFVRQYCERVADDFVVCSKGYISKVLQKDGQSSLSPSEAGAPVPLSTAGQTDTSDWKTYRNEEYGFEFKYPDTYIVEPGRGNGNIISYSSGKSNHIEMARIPDEFTGLSPINLKDKNDFYLYVEKYLDAYIESQSEDRELYSLIKTSLDSRTAVSIQDKRNLMAKWFVVYTGNSVLEMISIASSVENEQLQEAILSTFKFID